MVSRARSLRFVRIFALSLALIASVAARAEQAIRFFPQTSLQPFVTQAVISALGQSFALEQYREVRLRPTLDGGVVFAYLFARGYHQFEVARVELNSSGAVTQVNSNYLLTAEDHRQLFEPAAQLTPQCPDASVQFIVFAPNQEPLEQQVSLEVAAAAEAAGLKTVRLLTHDATAANYLNYMSCPQLVGNFYDGDSNPESFITVDGEISAAMMQTLLKGAFRHRVTNIWLACQAFNDPMLSSVLEGAQAQKYAAGINNLQVGPSDQTGACAMEAAIHGQPMTEAFQSCYLKYDVSTDHWGFDGSGSDVFAN